MKEFDLVDAKEKGLVQLTVWLKDVPLNHNFIDKANKQVLVNRNRETMLVRKGGLLALFVNDVT